MSDERWILHADMDAFYASVEQREDPTLRGRPVIVGGTSERGVVTAASYEARAFGVRSAMPAFKARELCPQAVFVPGRMALYAEISAQVRDVFFSITPSVEPLALDEAFLDISGSAHLFESLEAVGVTLKERVKRATDLNVSVGIGPSKLVAKLACTLGKPDGLKLVHPEEVQAFLEPLPIRSLWGVGPVTGRKLEQAGIVSIGDAARMDLSRLRRVLGERAATFQARARGVDPSPVAPRLVPKSCGEENTFERDVSAPVVISGAITTHSEEVARRLRAANLRGRTVTLKLKLGRASAMRPSRLSLGGDEPKYPVLSRSRTLDRPTDDADRIREAALRLWEEASVHEPIRLLGVTVSKLEPSGAPEQLDLFGVGTAADTLGPTLDKIQEKFGAGAIRRASYAPHKISPNPGKRR